MTYNVSSGTLSLYTTTTTYNVRKSLSPSSSVLFWRKLLRTLQRGLSATAEHLVLDKYVLCIL